MNKIKKVWVNPVLSAMRIRYGERDPFRMVPQHPAGVAADLFHAAVAVMEEALKNKRNAFNEETYEALVNAVPTGKNFH